MAETVAVLGASPKRERYSNQAVRLLQQHGHHVIPVNPAQSEIEGLAVARHVDHIRENVDTVTVYLNPAHSSALASALKALQPRRVIFNPGAENQELEDSLRKAGIEVEEACTLVLLRTGQF